jgi:hypothetical protein
LFRLPPSAELPLALRASGLPFFACAKKGNRKKAHPGGAVSGHPALRLRERRPGSADRPSLACSGIGAILRADPAGLVVRRSPRHKGPVWAASCRRSNSNSSLRYCVDGFDCAFVGHGWPDSWISAPFAVPSIAGGGDQGPQGRAHDARASAAVHGCTVSRPRRRREAQGSSIRTMRIEPPRRALAFLATFWAMPKSSPLARGERKLCISGKAGTARHWIPALPRAILALALRASFAVRARSGARSRQNDEQRTPATPER